MAQELVQQQQQQQQQVMQQTLSAQQVLVMRLLELPTEALLQRVENECLENPWLEKKEPTGDDDFAAPVGTEEGGDYNPADDYRTEDDIPSYLLNQPSGKADSMETIEYGETLSFYDRLEAQVGEYDLDENQRQLLSYLIGSLEESGLLKKSLALIADELAIYQGVDTTEKELEEVLHILWQFDPAGIGARSLQECLRLQVERSDKENPLREQMLQMLSRHWDDITHKRWDVIQRRMRLSSVQVNALQRELLSLNPRPGLALSEPETRSTQQVTPDFIVETDGYGNLTLSLNNSGVPDLMVSADATDKLEAYAKSSTLSQAAREDMLFTRRYVDRGTLFINAMRQRRETMLRTMTAIVHMQRDFFLEGDETLLRPMVLDDVAQRIGMDPSTVSRVCNSKYVRTSYGTFPLKMFFTHKAVQKDGDTQTVHQVMAVLRSLIENEDKAKPLNDDRLAALMQQQGYNIARRTIAKYREQMGIPVARLRR